MDQGGDVLCVVNAIADGTVAVREVGTAGGAAGGTAAGAVAAAGAAGAKERLTEAGRRSSIKNSPGNRQRSAMDADRTSDHRPGFISPQKNTDTNEKAPALDNRARGL